MSFQINFNVLKGWPNPSILERVAVEANGVTILEGMGGHIDANGNWALGVTNVNQQPFVFRNSTGDSDADHAFNASQDYNQVNWGGIQGLAISNPLWFQTSQFGGAPVVVTGGSITVHNAGAVTIQVGDQLFLDLDGKFKTATDVNNTLIVTGVVIVGVCTRASHQGTGQNPPALVDIIADDSKRLSA